VISYLTDKTVTCRKRHRCEWCPEMIEAGEKARYRSYTVYGEDGIQSGHMHMDCHEVFSGLDWDDLPRPEFALSSFQRGTCICDGEDWSK